LEDVMLNRQPTYSYFVVMQDFGKLGLGACDVYPELTRRNIVDRIKSGDYRHIVFIHFVDGLFVEDVTHELVDQAEQELRNEDQPRTIEVA
jgi:hypothetical protein